jgi:type I restriction enzyme R subunit
MTVFSFLKTEWPDVYEAADKSARAVVTDPRTSCFYARRTLELIVAWVFKHDPSTRLPYQDNLSALIHEPTFKKAAGEAVFAKARLIIRLGNEAVHSHRPIPTNDALVAVKELFHVTYWLAYTYARGEKPPQGLVFTPAELPKNAPLPKQTAEQLQQLETGLRERDEKLAVLLADKNTLDAELVRLRAEVAEAKKKLAPIAATHDFSEAETRDTFIDLLLREAGWALGETRDREYQVSGMPNNQGIGFVDYVLWGDDGKPLGLVEAKRTRRDPREGEQQAKLYADCLEKQFGQRPVVFYTNGYDHWLWDDTRYPPRKVQGFFTKHDLELMIQRRSSLKPLGKAEVNTQIADRYYQERAIRRVCEAFEKDHERRALLVMATGAGKTRTVIALADLMMKCNWVKRVLFLADRVALVNQAVNAFKKHLSDSSPVNLVTEKDTEGRVYVSTYPTMMGLIDETDEGLRRFGPGYFDLIVIDEAHRSVYQKYRAIFEYFDSFLVGLTATPREEVDRDTYGLFELEKGVPTDAYELKDAVSDKYLVPAKSVSVPLKYQREGIKYEELSDEDKERWDALEWDEEDGTPHEVNAEAVNRWFFNKDTVDKVVAHVMTEGLQVDGGDRIGKTIIFAKNQDHAQFIKERFDANYPKYKGRFARVITFKTEYAQSVIDAFAIKNGEPHIAISVDMLDTGIDVPEVLNLVFFKLVRSKTKFWQMVGRGTRLCPDVFGPGMDKSCFYIFDYCQNLEYFSQSIEDAGSGGGEPLGKRLFKTRLELIAELDKKNGAPSLHGMAASDPGPLQTEPETEGEIRSATAKHLFHEVEAMNLDNFVVRAKRRYVEKYSKPKAWVALTREAQAELAYEVAGLPSDLVPEQEEAKRFDLLMLYLQLAWLRHEPGFDRMRARVKVIASLLEEKAAIPKVKERLPLLQDLQDDEWWRDTNLILLERVRRHVRDLVQFIEFRNRKPVYTDFEDQMGAASVVELPGFTVGGDFERFRQKAQAFLRAHQDNLAINKLRLNKALTKADLAELERVLAESKAGGLEEIEKAKTESNGLGLFVRSLVGLDRQAAKDALAGFLAGKSLTANQIEFVDQVVNYLTEYGVMNPERLYESPFTNLAPQGPDKLFSPKMVDELIAAIDRVREMAVVA